MRSNKRMHNLALIKFVVNCKVKLKAIFGQPPNTEDIIKEI